MTIAMCYVSPEGVVLGADSTTSFSYNNGHHFFNQNQKLYEIGEESTIGIVTWGLGTLFNTSFRTLIAKLDDQFKTSAPISVKDAAEKWSAIFWSAYNASPPLATAVAKLSALAAKKAYGAASPLASDMRTEVEENEFTNLRDNLRVGFCLAGHVLSDRHPCAYEVQVDPISGPGAPIALAFGTYSFWGVPNMAERLIYGYDIEIRKSVVRSPFWTGTEADYDALMGNHKLHHDMIPIRDAIDFVHTCIHSTIKALKFSRFSQVCGGPIEIAVITTDR